MHFLCGRGLLQLFKLQLQPIQTFCLSMITGVILLSFGPCFLQLLKIPLTKESVTGAIEVTTALFCVPLIIHIIKNYKNFKFPKIVLPQLYELPFFIVFGVLLGVSVWRCYYYPPIAADMLNGPELLAKYAVIDKTMISSVFHIDMQVPRYGASNIFKSPFITCLQIIYKLLVQPFGQLWLSVLVLSFITWLYVALRERLHPIIAGTLMIIFLVVPELYAYTFLMLYDYSTMIFFFCGFYYLIKYMENEKMNYLAWSALLFGFSTYIRTETLVFVFMLAPLLAFQLYKKKVPMVKAVANLAILTFVSAFFYFLCMNVFVKHFVPLTFDLSKNMNPKVTDISLFFERFTEISTKLIFSIAGDNYYGPFFDVLIFVIVADLVYQKFISSKKAFSFSTEAMASLYCIAILYFGMAFLGHVFPSFSIENTTKRGMFKVIVVGLWYMGNSGFLLRISAIVNKWEYSTKEEPQAVAAAPAAKKPAKK